MPSSRKGPQTAPSRRKPRKTAAAPAESVAQQLSHLFFDLHLTRVGAFQKLMQEFDLVPTQARTLAMMEPERTYTMSEVAQMTFCEPSNLTGIIDKLQARGLVERSLGPTDRRVKMVALTAAGVALRVQLMKRIREPAPWMHALSEEEQRALLALLRKGMTLAQATSEPIKS